MGCLHGGLDGLWLELADMSTLTPLEKELLACIREQRRLGNQIVRDSSEVGCAHREMDRLLQLQSELDDPDERYDAPHRKEYRNHVNRLFNRHR